MGEQTRHMLDWSDATIPPAKATLRRPQQDRLPDRIRHHPFHTAEGVTTFDHPEKIASAYRT